MGESAEGGRPVPADGRSWGIRSRRNRPVVRLLLKSLGWRRSRFVVINVIRRAIRSAACGLLGSDIRSRSIGPDLFLPHPYGIVVHARARIGRGCTIYHNVTIGEDNVRPGVPSLGDDVIIGAGAAVLGDVRIGSGARVGANAVVLSDVPPGATVAGVPARLVGRFGSAGTPKA